VVELSGSEKIIFSQVKKHSNELIKSVNENETTYRIKTIQENKEPYYLRISCTSNYLVNLKLLVNEYQKRGNLK